MMETFVWAPGRSDAVRPDSSDNCKIRITSTDAVTASDQTDGFFSIHESKKIKVEFPNNGEDFYAGKLDRFRMVITWTSYAISGNVNIYYSLQNGAENTWVLLVGNYPSTGAYVWDYANDPLIGSTVVSTLGRIKIQDAADSRIWDINDVPFLLNVKKVSGSINKDDNLLKKFSQRNRIDFLLMD